MMPAPIRTTSGSVSKISGIGFLLKFLAVVFLGSGSGSNPLQLARAKRHRGSWLKDHVGATPGRIVGQLPAVSGPDRVLSEQDIAGVEKKMFTLARFKIQRA